MRRLTFAFAVLVAAPVLAAETADGPGRYALGPSSDGFVRLDTATGAVSHCVQTNDVWRCEPLPQEDAALRSKLDALTAEVKRLSALLSALDARVASLAAVAPPAAPVAEGPAQGSEQSLAREAVGRFMDMVRRLKRGGEASPI